MRKRFFSNGICPFKTSQRIAADKVQKLFFIKNNAQQLMSTHQVGVDWSDTDDDEDLNEDKCIVDENGSLMEVDELDTAALDR